MVSYQKAISRLIVLGIFVCQAHGVISQITISGKVIDAQSKEPLIFATIAIGNNRLGTISNSKGEFRLLIPEQYKNDSLQISFIGYQLLKTPIASIHGKQVFELEILDQVLSEVVIEELTGLGIIKKALGRIPENYYKEPYKSKEFIRLNVKYGSEYTHISEAVYELYHDRSLKRNQFKLNKNRSIRDEVEFGILGDITSSVKNLANSDLINNLDEINLLNKKGLKIHDFNFESINKFNGNEVFIISFAPKAKSNALAYIGKCYIDASTYAFLHFDFEVAPDKVKRVNPISGGFAGKALAKLFGVTINVLDSHITFSYKKVNNRYYFDLVNSDVQFELKYGVRKYIMNLESLLTVTEFALDSVKPFLDSEILGKNKRIHYQDAFNDSTFWDEYNVVLPDIDYKVVSKAIQAKNKSFDFKEEIRAKLRKYPKNDAARIDSILTFYHRKDLFNGNALIEKRGKVILQKSYNNDLTNSTKDSQFRIGSTSKTFTSVLIMLLEGEGKLSLNDPIKKYLPDYTHGEVTIAQLLSHRSGIPNYLSDENIPKVFVKPFSEEELITQFLSDSLEFESGTQFKYSNSGFVVLALIIEEITGKSYGEVL